MILTQVSSDHTNGEKESEGSNWNRGKFSSSFEELTEGQGEIALVLEYNSVTDSVMVVSSTGLGETYATVDKETKERMLAFEYTQACKLPKNLAKKIDMEKRRMHRAHTKVPGFTTEDLLGESEELVLVMVERIVKRKGVVTKKKYKPVAKKIKPVVTELPDTFRRPGTHIIILPWPQHHH